MSSLKITPRSTANGLLRLGTIFFVFLFVMAIVERSSERTLFVLTAYASIILAFVGGMNQAIAVQCNDDNTVVVATGIAVALISFFALVFEHFLSVSVLPLLAITYAIQAMLEARHPAWRRLRHSLCVSERRPAMLLAGTCCSLAPVSGGILLISCCLATLFVAVACVLPPLEYSEKSALNGCVFVVGSKNACKIAAVEQALDQYAGIRGVVSHAANSGVPEQPIGLETIVNGAKNRAMSAFKKAAAADISLGIESGLFSLQDPHSAHLQHESNENNASTSKITSHYDQLYDICVVSAFDGHQHSLGFSCAFEIPANVRRQVVDNGLDLSTAANAAGLTSDLSIGQKEGLIALLTRRRLTRKEYTIQAIHMALAPLDHPVWYEEEERFMNNQRSNK